MTQSSTPTAVCWLHLQFALLLMDDSSTSLLLGGCHHGAGPRDAEPHGFSQGLDHVLLSDGKLCQVLVAGCQTINGLIIESAMYESGYHLNSELLVNQVIHLSN